MRGMPAFASRAPSGLLGVLRAWLQAGRDDTVPVADFVVTVAQDPDAPCHGSVRVLVVDDNPVNLMLISAQLEARGLSPVLAADGAEALALACELDFDLILMDLQMPILDGLGATSAIRRDERQKARTQVPVIAYSSASPGAAVLARHGLNGSLSKPCDDHELEDCLVRWCPTYRPAAAGREVPAGPGPWLAARPAADATWASLR